MLDQGRVQARARSPGFLSARLPTTVVPRELSAPPNIQPEQKRASVSL